MSLDHSVWANTLRYGCDSMVLHMARLDVLRVACNEGEVFALLVLEANFPTSEEFRPWLYVVKTWILEWSLELATHNVFEAVVRDDVVVCALVLYGNSLLHQTSFLELIAINERATKASLLVRRETLCKVGVHLTRGIRLAQEWPIE